MGFLYLVIGYFVVMFAIGLIARALRNGKGPLSDLFNFITGLLSTLFPIIIIGVLGMIFFPEIMAGIPEMIVGIFKDLFETFFG
ncbi:MAG: hypothetical protein E7608_00015 [Ruminococcaceae bacterium]|nr:hypothetical protein [Oscillospiraceae bacterium]